MQRYNLKEMLLYSRLFLQRKCFVKTPNFKQYRSSPDLIPCPLTYMYTCSENPRIYGDLQKGVLRFRLPCLLGHGGGRNRRRT